MGSGVDAGWVGAGRPGPGRWMHPARRQGRKTLLGLRGEQGFVTTARIRRPFPVSARHAGHRRTNRWPSRRPAQPRFFNRLLGVTLPQVFSAGWLYLAAMIVAYGVANLFQSMAA